MKPFKHLLASGLFAACAAATGAQSTTDDAAAFGAIETIFGVELSADGNKLVYVGGGAGATTMAVVVDLATGNVTQATRGDGKPINISTCDWSANDRLVCRLYGIERIDGALYRVARTVAMDIDGKNQVFLGIRDTVEQQRKRLNDGRVIDWMNGVDGKVLMQRTYVREDTTGRLTGRNALNGQGVDLIDTRTGKATVVERAGEDVDEYISDGLGHVRLITTETVNEQGYDRGLDTHSFRMVNDSAWHKLGTFTMDRAGGGRGKGIIPVAVDPRDNVAYVLDTLDGRHALFKITLDEAMKRDLVFASNEVDVDGVVTIGRNGRVIGATYTTDRNRVHYFDPEYQKLHEMISRALPKLPLIDLSAPARTNRSWRFTPAAMSIPETGISMTARRSRSASFHRPAPR